mmetsp:Transcript_20235/g.31633  ORF Transcript_20235/g.31633 Transcript_20235/m.31633 type:complete len:164 (-) Transcript_20235:121-612(-)
MLLGCRSQVDEVLKFIKNKLESHVVLNTTSYDHKLLEQKDEGRTVWYSAYRMPWPIDSRDCVWETLEVIQEDGRGLCLGRSVRHKKAPARRGYVRVDMRHCGGLLDPCPENPNHTVFTFLGQADLKGWIPGVAGNLASVAQAECVKRLKKHFKPKKVDEAAYW